MAKIDSVYDFSDKALVELKSWLEPWFKAKDKGCECVPAAPSGDTIDAIIAGLGPDAWWKLNETSGAVAHDSSGNGHHLTATTPYVPPTWAQPAGPPGTTTAKFVDNTNRVSSSVSAPMTGYTNNFTAGAWVKLLSSPSTVGEIIGQGMGWVHVSGGGWGIGLDQSAGKFVVFAASGAVSVYANNAYATGTWYFLAVVRDAGTWKFYVNGLLQSATSTTAPGTVNGNNTWLGYDDFGDSFGLHDALLSYAFIVNRVLSGTELLSVYNSAVIPAGANAGKALIANGLNGTYWDFASSGSGTTAQRPTLTTAGGALFVGTGYFDTTLGKPIWWNGTVWKDATGTTV